MDNGQTSKPLKEHEVLKTGKNFFDYRNNPTPNWSTYRLQVKKNSFLESLEVFPPELATDALASGRGQLKGATGTDWMRDPYSHDS